MDSDEEWPAEPVQVEPVEAEPVQPRRVRRRTLPPSFTPQPDATNAASRQVMDVFRAQRQSVLETSHADMDTRLENVTDRYEDIEAGMKAQTIVIKELMESSDSNFQAIDDICDMSLTGTTLVTTIRSLEERVNGLLRVRTDELRRRENVEEKLRCVERVSRENFIHLSNLVHQQHSTILRQEQLLQVLGHRQEQMVQVMDERLRALEAQPIIFCVHFSFYFLIFSHL